MKQADPVQGPRFDANRLSPRGKAEMQNRVGLDRPCQGIEARRDLGIDNRQDMEFERDAEPGQPRFLFAERADHLGGRVFRGAGKGAKTRDEDAKRLDLEARAMQESAIKRTLSREL